MLKSSELKTWRRLICAVTFFFAALCIGTQSDSAPGILDLLRSHPAGGEIGSFLLAPDGKTAFFTWDVTGVSQIWKLDDPLRFPKRLTANTDVLLSTDITPNGTYLILNRSRTSLSEKRLALLATEGGKIIDLSAPLGSDSRCVSISNDGLRVYYQSQDRKKKTFSIYMYSIVDRRTKLLLRKTGSWQVDDVLAEDQFLISRQRQAWRNYYIWRPPGARLLPTLAQFNNPQVQIQQVRFSNSGGSFFVLMKSGKIEQGLYLVKDEKLTSVTLQANDESLTFTLDHRHFHLYINRSKDGRLRLEVRDPGTLKLIPGPDFGDAMDVRLVSTSRYGRYMTLAVNRGAAPFGMYVYDWKDSELTRWIGDSPRSSAPQPQGNHYWH